MEVEAGVTPLLFVPVPATKVDANDVRAIQECRVVTVGVVDELRQRVLCRCQTVDVPCCGFAAFQFIVITVTAVVALFIAVSGLKVDGEARQIQAIIIGNAKVVAVTVAGAVLVAVLTCVTLSIARVVKGVITLRIFLAKLTLKLTTTLSKVVTSH